MAYDRLYKLYDALKEQNATSVDREAFHKQMSAPGFEGYQNRLQLYKELKANGYVDYPNYETFSAELGMHAAAPAKGAQKHQQRQQTTPAKPQSAKPQPTKPQQGWTAAQRKQAEAQLEQNAYDNARLSRQWQQQSDNLKRKAQRAKRIGPDYIGEAQARAQARRVGIEEPRTSLMGTPSAAATPVGVTKGDDGKWHNQYELEDGSLTTDFGDVLHANVQHEMNEKMHRHGLDPEKVNDDDIMKMYADEAYDAALQADKAANQQAVDEDAGRTPIETMRRAATNYEGLDDDYSDVEREVKRAQRINPDAMVAETMRRMPPSVLSRLRRQYGLYFEQHPKELKKGQNAQQAAEEAIKGSIYQHVFDKLKAANAPKSTLEYLMRKIADQPLYSQHIAAQTAAGAITGNHSQYLADEQAMSAYENGHPVTGFFGTLGNMAADPTMYLGGWIGSMASKAVARGIGRAVVKGASEKMAERLAGRTLAGRIAQGVAAGAGNLGFYEGSHAAIRQDRTGEHSIGDVLAATGRGVLLGAATGVAAPLIGNVADKWVARTASTGGKLAVRTGETATSVLAEGTIFAAPELVENARLADGDPNKRSGWSIWAGNVGTMAGFKGKHLIESAPRVLAELRTDGARRGVGFEGRLRNMLDRTPADLQMTNADLQELRDRGYGGLADLYTLLGSAKTTKKERESGIQNPAVEQVEKPKDKDLDGYATMQRLMDDHSVSAAVRAKAYYLLTGKMLPMPTVLSYDRTANDDGTITITALGAENPVPAYGSGPKSKMKERGADVVVRKTFKSKKEADVYEAKVRRQIELNTVDVGEQLREAQVQDEAIDAAIDVLYPKGDRVLLKNQYYGGKVKSIKNAIDKYLEGQLTANSPHNPHTIRRDIEEKYGVDIDKALKKEPNRRTKAEADAVQEYANELYNFGGREETAENAQVGGGGPAGVPPAAGAPSEEAATPTTENAAEQAREEGRKAWTDNDGADDDSVLQGAVDEKAARAHAALDRLNELFDEEAVSVIKEDPEAMLNSPALSEEHRAAIQEYIEAMAGLDGVKEAAQKAAEQNQAEVENEVVKSTNKETKLLMPATVKDDSGNPVSIYVVDGKLVLNTSGGIDPEKSAQTIVIYDPNTGQYRFVDPKDIVEMGQPVSPADAVQSATEAIQQRHNGIFDHAEQAAQQQKSLPAPTAEGGEGPTAPTPPAADEGLTGSESAPAPEEKQPIQMGSGALGSIPKNEKGEPVYEQAEPSTAWQAILEQTEGDTDMAAGVVDSMIADKEAAVKKAEKEKPKHADTIAGKIAAEKERKAAIERAKAELEAWKKIAAAKAGHEQAVGERKAAEVKEQEQERHEAAVAQAEQDKAEQQRKEGEQTEHAAQRGEKGGSRKPAGEGVGEPDDHDGEGNKPTETEWENETAADREARIREWLSDENLEWAEGKSLQEIVEYFGNELEPIAVIPKGYLKHLGGGATDSHVYCGKGYFIDHAVNHHDEEPIEEYLKIQDILSTPTDVKIDTSKGRPTLLFIKQYDKYYVEMVSVGEDGTNRVVLHKSFFHRKKMPHKALPSVAIEKPSADEITAISPAKKNEAAGSSDFSALDDSGKDSASGANAQEDGGNSAVAVKEKPKDERDGDGKQLTPAPKGGRRRRGGFKGSGPAAKSSEELFAEEKHGRYSGFYKEVLDSSSTIKEAVQKFVGRLRELAAAHKDWSSRKYKSNSGVVAAGSKYGELEAGNRMRIDVVNEKRRENTLRGIEKEAKEVEGYIRTLLERCGISKEDSGQYFSEKDSFESFLRENEKPKKDDDDDDGPDGPAGGAAAAGGKGKPESDSESEEVKKLRKEYDEACDHLEDVMTEWDDKIIDYIAEHYPTQATVSAETRSPKGIKEREAMDNDPVLKKMREERNAAVKKADEERYKAFKRMDAAETGKGEQEPASPSAAAEQKKPAERKIEDVGEHIAGARKDALAELSQSVADVTLESLIELPASKAFKRPDLKRAVKEGVLREEDARFAEAVMAAYLGAAKPKLKEGYRRAKSEAAVRAWAEHAKEGVDLLAKLFSLDEKGRDKYMAEVRARKMYSEEEVEARKRQLEQWNPGQKLNGTCYPLNPIDVMARVMERLGYEPGAKVTLPVVEAVPASGYDFYVLKTRNGKTYYPGRWLTTIDDVVDEIVYAAKVENADPDTDHPAGKFSVKGVGEVLTEHTGKWTVITQRSLSARVEQHTFGSKEEAEAFAEKYKAGGKNRYASAPEEEVRAAGYTQYEIVYRHDSPTKGTGVYMPTGKMYGSLEEARAAIDGEHDELNGIVNAKLAEAKGKGGEGRKKDYVKIVSYTEDGRTWKYGVVLDDKYAPKKTSTDSMPFYLGDGFGTRKEAQAFVDEHREEWDAKIADIEKARRDFVYFNGTGERTGQDWRKGADVSAEQLMEQFGFRGVQFGNWTNQRDRQAAVNGAFDALMDLAQILGVSPRALSLNGELGLAFGSRGGGSAKAHYEPDEVVINLTKTQGAGSLAHEWWHALDNYFARHGNVKGGMVTESKGIAMRDELREAFNALIDSVAGSDYNIRSRQRGASYWGRPAEETARLFAAWVSDELQKRGLSSPFLSDTDPGAAERYAEMMYRLYKAMYESRKAETGGKAMTFEEFKKTPLALSGFVFPGTEELAAFGGHLRNIFNTVQEKVDGQTGKTLLYHRGPVVAEPNEAEQALLEAVNGVLKDTGIEVVTDTDEGQKVLDAANGNDVKLEASHRSGEAEERNKMWRLIDRATAMFTGKTEKEAREARRKEMQKITAERKEMYDRVLSGNFDEVTLRQIDNYIDNFSPYNNEWRPISKRLPQKALRGLRKGERASAVDVLFSRISESAVPKNERAGAEGKRRIEEKKKELLKKWAIATGNWHTSVSDFTDAKEPLGSGKDSDVYQSKDGKHVIKVSKGKDGLKKFRPDIDAVTLFNYIFPESRYEILGYGEVDGKFVKFLKQPVVDFTGSKPLSAEERVAYMADMGFKPVNKEKTAFSNGTIVVADLQGNNIVRDKSGNIRVIDADVKLHTKDFGGQYSYPPVEADTALPQANNGGNEKPRMQKVYHGSGADFDEFDNSHMGEGEGAQAYGWGTYVTEVEGIGRTYAKATARYDDNSSEEVLNRVESLAADLIKDRFGFRPGLSVSARGDNYDLEIPSDKKTLEQIKSYFDEYPYMWNAKVDRELSSFNLDDAASRREFANWVYEIVEPFAADAVGYAQKEETASRHLYTVEIPDDNGENYIDYNGRISDIPSQKIDAICTELEKLGWKRKDLPSMVRLTDGYGNIVLNPNAAGADLYEEIKVALKSQKLASELLSRAGFAGIKYPAEYMSGGRKDGAKNYVIFNEKDARITDHVRFFRTSGGEAYGFTVGGKIYVDPRIATADTPIHEYAHLWGDMMRRVNPKAWGDIVRLMKGKGGLWDWVKKNYPELETDDEVADEVLAQFSGKRGAERLREEMRKTAEGSGSITEKAKAISALQRVKEALGRFWRGVAELLHIRFTTAEEVADRVMADLLHGVDPRKVSNDNRYNEFAEKHKVDANEVKDYATAIKDGNLMAANRALSEIRRTLRVAHREMNLQEFGKFFRPINQELAERFGDIEKLRQEHIAAAEREHNAMEAARKKAEEEEAKKRKRQEELSMLTADEIDKRYAEALERGDEAAAREMLDEAARRNGYGDTESDYQGVGAWVAPSNPGYESDEARRADVEDNAPDVNLEDMALGYNLQPDDYFTHPERYSQDTLHGRESTQAIHAALEALKRGDKDVKVKVYRAVPTSVKEGSLRNGDWVTPSRKYAEMHGKSRLEGKYRIIEDEVPAKDLWWDGNDANEFGYDDGRGYKYKNTKNNRKLNDLVTRDDDGNIIPPSKRFNEREQDVRYSLRHVFGGNSGYVGYSMSKRAAQAREDGRYPKTDFRKEYSVTPKTFDALVDAGVIDSGEWHHTSMYGNKTPFYGWKPMYDAVYAANKKEVDKMARTLKMQQTEAEFSDYLDNDNPYRYRPTSEEYQKKMGDIDRQESHAARDINLMYDDAYNPETERKRMQELQSLREKSGKLKDEVRRQYPEDAAIEAENRKGVDWHVEQIEKRNKEREALRQKFHDYFDAKRDELVYDEMEKAGILTMGADGPHWSKPKYAEIFNHYKDAAIDTIAEAMAERLKNPYDEDYAEGISEYRKDLQKVKADKWAEGNALNAKYRDKEFRKQHPDYYKREKMLEEEKERLREKYEALEEDVLKRHPEELERRQKAFEWPSDEEAQQQAREKLLAERLQQFFEEDTADPDEGKKFRLLDDDDPQAQELSLPEGEPKETLAQAMVRRVKELAAKLGAKVRIVTSADDLPKTPGSRQRRMKGMYDTRTGEVTIVIGNHENLADVENTVLHEAVGHRGFRVLFDTKEKFDHAMDELYRVSGGKITKWIDDKVRKLYDDEVDRIMERKKKERRARGEDPSEHHLEDMAAAAIEASKKKDQFRREATEEYGARLAGRIGEKGFEKLSAEEQTFWGRLKAMLQKALQRLAEGLNITGRHEWTDKDWAYVLHEAYKREKNGGKPSIFDEADTIAMRMRTGFGEGKEERRKMTTLSGEEAKQALNEIFSAESHTVKPEKISSLAKFRDIFSKPIRTFLGEVIKVKDAVWNKVLRENRQNISGAILPTLQNADFAIRDTDGSILYVKRFLNSTGESTYNVAVVNKHGELEDYISSVHIKTNNNLLNKIGKGAELLIPENRNGYGHEVPSSSTPDAKIDIENESGNTFGSNKYKKSSDENPDEGMMFRDGDDDDIGDVDLGDAVDKMREAAVESNANNLQAKREAMKAIGGNLSKLRQAMARQKVYDKGTVKSVTDMAREMLQNGMLDKLSGYEAKRILSAAANVTGAENTTKQINKLMDVMVDNQLRNAGDTFGKLLHSKGTRVNASGVEVQGKLDPDGAAIVDALKKGVQLDKEELNGRIGKALDKIGSEDKVIADQAANELAGLQLASRYVEDIKGSKAEETELRESLKEAKAQKDAGKMSAEAYKQYCEATEDAIRQNKIERADAYRQLIAQLGGVMGESAERAKAWREAEKQRVQDIQHNANSDMQGRPCNEHHKPSSLQKLCNSDLIRGLLMPLATFEQMLRMFGNKNVHGEGYLWNRFVRGWLRASENEYSGYRDALKELDDKVSEIFGKKMRWGDIFSLERKLPTMEVKFWDGGEMKPHTLTQGNLAYIYMVDKMSDGRMKLRAMGITEGDVEQIAKALDPKLKKLADWMQDEFLVQRRNKYNEVHKRMFGASMAAIENYFPLKILSGARTENVDVADDTGEPTMTSTTTGSIVKRRRNNLALDITNADAFSVILEHLQDMEHWAAYSEFNRDLNTLLSYRRFKNQVMNMSSAYGAGATLWKNFRNVCQLAAGSYRPPVATLDKTMVNLAKGVTAAKISFRIFTAIKQLLSFPAYLPDASARYLLQNLANPVGAWKWSIENLPLFHKRWNSRMAGDPRLLKTEMDWKMWRSRVVQMASKYGMSPNAFVDAVTVAMGAHAIYKTKLAKYLKQGYDKDKAEEKARQDAEIAYNQTQQSSEGAFLSTMQADRTWGSVLFTVFRNSAMSYTRQEYDALRNLARKLTTKGYKEKSIGFMAKQMVRDGLDENTAWRNAKRTYSRSIWREFVRVATFGYILQLAWNLGAYLPYLLLGDNDDDKKKMLEDAGLHALVGSVEGLTGGDVLSTAGQYALTGEGTIGNLKKEMPLTSDLHAIYQSFDYDAVQATNDVLNLLVQAGVGVNPQSLTDAVVGVMDYCENNPADARECALLIARIFNTPQSQLDKIYFDEIDLDGSDARKLSPKQIAERYAKYKLRRNTPLTAWMYGEDGRKERVAKYKKAANDVAKERLSALTDSRSGEDFTDWRNEYKQTSEGWGRINGLKDTDPDQYAAERKQIAGTPADTRYRIENRYKARINKLTDAWLKAKTPARRMKLADAMVALKKDEAKHLAAGK